MKLDDERVRDKRFGLILRFLERNSSTSEGHAVIREKVKSEPEVEAAIISGNGFLFDLPKHLQEKLFAFAHHTHVPEAQKMFDQACKLLCFADNYDRVYSSISRHWYNGPIADRMATRIEV